MLTCGSHDIGGRESDLDIISSVFGEKLGPELMLMAVPFTIEKYADLGKPLADKIEILEDSGLFDGFGHSSLEGDVQLYHRPGLNSFGKIDGEDSLVMDVVVIGMFVFKGGQKLMGVENVVGYDSNRLHLAVAPVFLLPSDKGRNTDTLSPVEKSALGILESVPVKMEPELLDGLCGWVFPRKELFPSDQMGGRIEAHIHGIARNLFALRPLCKEKIGYDEKTKNDVTYDFKSHHLKTPVGLV